MSAAEAAAAAADTSIQLCGKKHGSSSSSNRSSMLGDLGAEPGWKAGAAAAAGKAVCIDEEIFAATLSIFMGGFLQMPGTKVQQVDCQQAAADVSGLVAITNSFLSQPWKQWLYCGMPGLCQVRGVLLLRGVHCCKCVVHEPRHIGLCHLASV
jgi:hypothetical protein